MAPESTVISSNDPSATMNGCAPGLSSAELQKSLTFFSAQIDQLCQERNELRNSLVKLQAELGSEREVVRRLESQRAQNQKLVAALWDKVFPPDKVNEDLRNYPPLDECHSLDVLEAEMRVLSQSIKEQHAK